MDSRTVLLYYIGQTFLATFWSDLDLLQAYNNLDTDQNVRTAFWSVLLQPQCSRGDRPRFTIAVTNLPLSRKKGVRD